MMAKSSEVKKLEANERQRKYDKLTTKEKLLMLDTKGLSAVKQRKRLARQLKK